MLQDDTRGDGSRAGSAAPAARSEAPASPVDERNPHWTKYRDLAEQVLARAKEPFEIADLATPCALETVGMVTRYAIRLALNEGDVKGSGDRHALSERAYAATATRFWAEGKAVQPQEALDVALRYAVLHVLSASGIEKRWQEAAEYQAAWDRTETQPASVPLRAARWVAHLWPIAAGIGIGASVGMGSAFVYYYVIAPMSRLAGH
jgi:hypothetical protein